MKKLNELLIKKLVIFLFVLGFISSAFAQEVKEVKSDLPLTVGVSGIVYHTAFKGVYKESSNDNDGAYSAFRIRPLFNFTNGNIEAVLKLEYDARFGQSADNDDFGTPGDQNDTEVNTDKGSESVGVRSHKKGLEIKEAFLKSKVDGVDGLTLKGGIANYDFPLIWGYFAPLANVNYANDIVDLGVYYVKPSEGNNNKDNDDSQIYIADAKIKFGESSIRPAFFYYQCEEAAEFGQFRNSSGKIYGLSLNLVQGNFGLDATGSYISGKDKITPKKYAAYAVDIAPFIKIDTIKVTPFFTLISGDKDSSDDKDTSFLNATIDGTWSGVNSYRLLIIEDNGSFITNYDPTNAGKYDNTSGYIAYGLAVDGTFGLVTIKIQGAYVQAEKVAAGMSKDIGLEADVNVGYAITKNSTLYVEGALLKTGKFYENAGNEKQTAKFINVGVTYSL